MYHVVANLEERFHSAEEALKYYNRPVQPYIPMSRMKHEDSSIPRICVAETVEDCLMGIGLLGRFRRCLGKALY